LASAVIDRNHPAKPIFVALSIFNLLKARRIENKIWVNPLPLGERRNLFIDQWHEEVLYQDFGFEKRHMHAILLVIGIHLLCFIILAFCLPIFIIHFVCI